MSDVETDIAELKRAAPSSVRTRLGRFWVYEIPPYMGRNPRTGASVPVPAKRRVAFLPEDELLDALPSPHFTAAEYASRYADDDEELSDEDRYAEIEIPSALAIPAPGVELACSLLFDRVAADLRRRGRCALSGFATFRRTRPKRGPRRAESYLEFRASSVWLHELNAWHPTE